MTKKRILLGLGAAAFLSPSLGSVGFAGDASILLQPPPPVGQGIPVFNMVFGNRQGLIDASQCNLSAREAKISPGWGMIGKVMELFCHMKNDLALTTIPGAATGTFSGQAAPSGRPSLKVRAITAYSATGFAVNGIAYDNQLQVWACNAGTVGQGAGADCTQTANYNPMAYVVWSQNAGGGKKGYLVIDTSVLEMNATPQSFATEVTFDMSTANGTGKYAVRLIGKAGGPGKFAYIRGEGTKNLTTGDTSAAIGYYGTSPSPGANYRLWFNIQKSTLTGGVWVETDDPGMSGNGVSTSAPNLAATADAASSCAPLTVTEVASGGEDRAYGAGASGSCASTVTLPKFVADSMQTIKAYTAAGVLSVMTANMAATPPSL